MTQMTHSRSNEEGRPLSANRFLQACRGLPVDTRPVWFMRQAGRYQPEYRALRTRYSLLEIANNPALCAEVTCRPVEELGVDAAILFSDIMVPLGPIGVDFEIREHVGPVVFHPIRTLEDVQRLSPLNPEEHLPNVLDAIGRIVERLGSVPLIGFAGAPFTLASYLIEGGPSRDYVATKRLMWSNPAVWNALMQVLTETVIIHLAAQVKAGAAAVQVFDSWIGALSVPDYRQYVLPYMTKIFAALNPLDVPTIYFGVGTGELLESMAEAGPTVMGVDWRVPVEAARRRLGPRMAIQGNLDPAVLLGDFGAARAHVARILDSMRGQPGFIFNLGHGVLKDTPVERLKEVVRLVHDWGQEKGSEE